MIELQKLDCNCNDCKHMIRDINKKRSFDHLHIGQEKASHRLSYGRCLLFDKDVSFIAGVCQLHTQECFEHRRN